MCLHGRHNGSYRLSSNGRQRGDRVRRRGGKAMLKRLGQLFSRGELRIRIVSDKGTRQRGTLGHSPRKRQGIGWSQAGSLQRLWEP